tara:strand:- start:7142 stop:7645 length:504 start_codon:yes stop_codon:yes gene_type:complete
MWWQFALSTESNWFTQQEQKGIVVDCNVLFSSQASQNYAGYVGEIYDLTDVTYLDVTRKITEYLSPVIPVVLGPQDYGDATVGYIRGQDAELGGSGDFITWKVAINYDKLFRAWQWLDQPATLFLAAAATAVDDVYASQRSAVVLEIRGSSQTSISGNLTLNYPRGI